jgi:hypothetical protein
VLGAAAGVFAVFAVEGLVEEIASDDPTVPGILLNVALAGVAWLAARQIAGPVRGGAVAIWIFTVPTVWILLFYGNGQSGTGWLRLILLLSAVVWLVLYRTSWTRGRAIFLAFAVLFVAFYVQFEVHRQFESASATGTVLPFPTQVFTDPFNAGISPNATSTNNLVGQTGDVTATVALLLGVGFLAWGGALHRRRLHGAALPFVVVGAIEGFAAAAVLGPNEGSVALGGLLAAAVGVALALAGRGDGRRGSVWVGVIAVTVGVVAAITDATTDALGRAGYAALVAVGLLVTAVVLLRVLGEPSDGQPNTADPATGC